MREVRESCASKSCIFTTTEGCKRGSCLTFYTLVNYSVHPLITKDVYSKEKGRGCLKIKRLKHILP